MKDATFSPFITSLMRDEIAPSIPYQIDEELKQNFISKVIDRFDNPYINHLWKNIALNYTSKMMLRCIPLLLTYYKHHNTAPQLFAFGFASYLYFMKAVKQDGKEFFGEFNGEFYLIDDELAEKFYLLWKNNPIERMVKETLQDVSFWGEDISHLPGFQQTVTDNLNSIINQGMKATLEKVHPKKIVA
jgi:tagaturonate reductase